MKRTMTICAWLLIVGHLLTEVHSIMYLVDPKTSEKEVDWFWSPTFRMNLSLLWYVKMAADNVLLIATFYVMSVIASFFSRTLFLISCVFFAYHVLDAFMFFWNFKRTEWVYWVLLAAVTACAGLLARKSGNIFYNYKSMN